MVIKSADSGSGAPTPPNNAPHFVHMQRMPSVMQQHGIQGNIQSQDGHNSMVRVTHSQGQILRARMQHHQALRQQQAQQQQLQQQGKPPNMMHQQVSIPRPFPIDTSWRCDAAAQPVRVQQLRKALDVTMFLSQLEGLLAQPIKIPGTSVMPYPSSSNPRARHSIFSVKGIWPSDTDRLQHASKLYNLKSVKSRTWLRDLLLEESDSDSEGEMAFTPKDLHALLKVHHKRRKLQKQSRADPANAQYIYYGAGLLSIVDPFPDQQATVLRHHPR